MDKKPAEVPPTVSDGTFMLNVRETSLVPLPITIKGCEINIDSLRKAQDSLSILINEGFIPFTAFNIYDKYYGIISLEMVDGCTVSHLTIHDSDSSHVIDRKKLDIGLCGPGPGFECKEYLIIRKDLSIYIADSISSSDLDDNGKEIDETTQRYIIYKKGMISIEGKIQLSDTIRQILD